MAERTYGESFGWTRHWTDEHGVQWTGSPSFIAGLQAEQERRQLARERDGLPRPPSRKRRRARRRGRADG